MLVYNKRKFLCWQSECTELFIIKILFKLMGINKIKLKTYDEKIAYEQGLKIEWMVHDMDKVTKGQLLANAYTLRSMRKIVINSECDGYCKIKKTGTIEEFDIHEALGYINDSNKSSFPNIPISTTDEFTGTTCIHWKKVGGYDAIGIPLTYDESDDLFLCAIYKDSKISLEIFFNSKVFKLKKGDTISFKFSGGKIIDFTMGAKPSVILSPIKFPTEDEDGFYDEWEEFYVHGSLLCKRKKAMKKVCFSLSKTDLRTFIQQSIESYRITFNSEGGANIDNIPYNYYMVTPTCQEVIQDMFEVLTESISKYDSAYAIDKLSTEQTESTSTVEFDYCYVYLMYDTNTGYYKIGMSNNPTYREGTLQSCGSFLFRCNSFRQVNHNSLTLGRTLKVKRNSILDLLLLLTHLLLTTYTILL